MPSIDNQALSYRFWDDEGFEDYVITNEDFIITFKLYQDNGKPFFVEAQWEKENEGITPSKAYEKVEQQVPCAVVIEMKKFKAAKLDYNFWWHYSI